jgi:hypothetical protein
MQYITLLAEEANHITIVICEKALLIHFTIGTVMKEETPPYFGRFKAEVMQGLYEGKSLSPNDVFLTPLMKYL